MKYLIFSLFFIYLSPAFGKEKSEVTISISEFCPFMCTENSSLRGYTLEILDQIFKDKKVPFKFTKYSWARGVNEVNAGKIEGILAPSKEEAPNLIYPNNPIGIQKNCFFTKKENPWVYTSKDSIKDKSIITYIGFGQSDDYKKYFGIEKYKQIFNEIAFDENYLKRARLMVKSNRGIAFWTDPSLIDFLKIDKNSEFHNYKSSGCVSSTYIYLAFSSKNKSISNKLKSIYDEGIVKLRKSGNLKKILKKYNLKDWVSEKEINFH